MVQHTLLVAMPSELLEPSHMKSDIKDFLSIQPLTKKIPGPEGNKIRMLSSISSLISTILWLFKTSFKFKLTQQYANYLE